MKEGGTSLRGGQGVKLYCLSVVSLFDFLTLVGVQKDVSCAQQAAVARL